jgi:putative phage-type endonuclease
MSERSDWLEWRRGGLGGSDIAAVMGLSPWGSPWSVWVDKAGLTPLDDENAADHLEFGRRVEPVLAQWFHDRTGLYVAGEQTWCSNPAEPWMRCTVDGFVFEADLYTERESVPTIDDALAVVEFKTTTDPPKAWEHGIAPAHYATQATWASIVTGLPVVWFGVLHMAFGHPQFRTYEFAIDDEDRELVQKRARAFWFDHVLTGTPPAVDASQATTDALAAAWEPIDGEFVEADETALYHVEQLRRLKAEAKALDEFITLRENAIKATLADATALTHGFDEKGKPIVLATWKPQKRAGYFVKPTEFRKFDIKPAKGDS